MKNQTPLVILALLVIILVTYWGLDQTFYQQDEWQELGLILSGEITPNPFDRYSFWQLLLGQGRPLSELFYYTIFRASPFSITPFAVFGIFFHWLNAILVFLLVQRLTRMAGVAAIAAIFFAVNAVAHESLTWVAAFGTLPATTLILLAILSYYQFIVSDKVKWFWLALLALFTSLLFKEIGIFLVVFLPAMFLVLKKESLRQTLKVNAPLLLYGVLVAIYRIGSLLASDQAIGTLTTGASSNQWQPLVNGVLYPLLGTVEAFVPPPAIFGLAKPIASWLFPSITQLSQFDSIAYTEVATSLMLVISGVSLWLLWRFFRSQKTWPTLILALLLIWSSFIPYIVVKAGSAYLDSRYYYIAGIGAGIILGILTWRVWQLGKVGKAVVAMVLITVLGYHGLTIRKFIAGQVALAKERRAILTTMKQFLPALGEKTVIYVAGDRDYHIPDHKLPFQQGIGYTLLVWYSDVGSVPKTLLGDRFLWEMGAQGYRETDEQGFGYFSRIDKLAESVREYKIPLENIFGFYWDSEKSELRPQTLEQLQEPAYGITHW